MVPWYQTTMTSQETESRIASLRINIARAEAKLATTPDGAGAAISLVWLKRDKTELTTLLAKKEAT